MLLIYHCLLLQLEEKADQRVKIKDRDNNWMGGLIGGQKNTRRLVFTHRSKVASDANKDLFSKSFQFS